MRTAQKTEYLHVRRNTKCGVAEIREWSPSIARISNESLLKALKSIKPCKYSIRLTLITFDLSVCSIADNLRTVLRTRNHHPPRITAI